MGGTVGRREGGDTGKEPRGCRHGIAGSSGSLDLVHDESAGDREIFRGGVQRYAGSYSEKSGWVFFLFVKVNKYFVFLFSKFSKSKFVFLNCFNLW